jgi:hypothetical protein
MINCTWNNRNVRVIGSSTPRDHKAVLYLKAGAKIFMILLSNLALFFLHALPTKCVWTMHVKKVTVKLDNKIIKILLSSVGWWDQKLRLVLRNYGVTYMEVRTARCSVGVHGTRPPGFSGMQTLHRNVYLWLVHVNVSLCHESLITPNMQEDMIRTRS